MSVTSWHLSRALKESRRQQIVLHERKFPGTAQKTLEVQLTLGYKDEKDKYY